MLNIVTENKLLFVGTHVLIGFLATFSQFPILFGSLVIIIGVIIIFSSSNKSEEALLLSGYVVGVEVFLRMTEGFISYETGKYGVALFLTLGMFVGPIKQQLNISFVIYILLLLLGIVFTQVPEGESIRKAILFNLTGPISLGICALYLYKRPLSYKEIASVLFFVLLPIISMVTYMYFRTPNLSEIVFGTDSSFVTSGGFGPNQVTTILGFGMFILGVFLYLKTKITGYLILDIIMLLYFTFRGLLTFSRGGVITAAIGFIVFSILLILYRKGSIMLIFKYLLVSGVFITGVWLYTSDVTGGMLDNRYTGKDATGKKKDVTSGRIDLFSNQLEGFKEAPLFGIGVGNGKYKREIEGKLVTTSHNEVSRLIEEHGTIGVIILMILVIIPASHFYNKNNFQRAFLISFFLFWFLTINHSAMRIAFPALAYGLCLINITTDETEE